MTTNITIHRVTGLKVRVYRENDFDRVEVTINCEDGETSITMFPWSNCLPEADREKNLQTHLSGLWNVVTTDRRTK